MAKTVRFLAVGSRIVVMKGTRYDRSQARWYTTTKVVELEREPAVGNCPITHANVLRYESQGYTLFFPPNIIREREVLEEGDRVPDVLVRPILFTYDIPDNATIKIGEREVPFPNPSNLLRRFAVRLNLSCWVLNEGDTPHALIATMLDSGCNPYVFKFDPTEADKLVSMAVTSLRKEIDEALRRAEVSRARAERQLDESQGEEGLTPEEAEARYVRRAVAIQTRLAELLDDMNAVAARFGLRPETINAMRLGTTGGAIREAMETRARGYVAGIKALKEAGTMDAESLASAAEAATIVTEPMIDALIEAGKPDEAEALRAAMGVAGPPVPVEVPKADEDGTFSLAGVGSDDDQYPPDGN